MIVLRYQKNTSSCWNRNTQVRIHWMTYVSVAVASLRLDVCDDGQVVKVDLKPLVESVLDNWLRAPGAAPLVGADPETHTKHRMSLVLVLQGAPQAPGATSLVGADPETHTTHHRTSLVLVRQGVQRKPQRTPSTYARVKLTRVSLR